VKRTKEKKISKKKLAQIVKEMKEFSKGHTLRSMTIKQLIETGRRY
jgi:hypothetical protein